MLFRSKRPGNWKTTSSSRGASPLVDDSNSGDEEIAKRNNRNKIMNFLLDALIIFLVNFFKEISRQKKIPDGQTIRDKGRQYVRYCQRERERERETENINPGNLIILSASWSKITMDALLGQQKYSIFIQLFFWPTRLIVRCLFRGNGDKDCGKRPGNRKNPEKRPRPAGRF